MSLTETVLNAVNYVKGLEKELVIERRDIGQMQSTSLFQKTSAAIARCVKTDDQRLEARMAFTLSTIFFVYLIPRLGSALIVGFR